MKIKEMRKKLGFSQKKVSELLGIPVRTLQGWEAGERVPPEYVERLVVEKLQLIASEKGN